MSETTRAQEVLKRLANTTADENGTWLALRKRCCRGKNGCEIARAMTEKPPRKKRENHRMRKALIRRRKSYGSS